MHPLTKLLTDESMWDSENAKADDEIITQYLSDRADWLKKQGERPVYIKGIRTMAEMFLEVKTIDQAFELSTAEKDHQCGGVDCIVCGYREKIKPQSPELPKKIKLSGVHYRPDELLPSCLADKINELIDYLSNKEGR